MSHANKIIDVNQIAANPLPYFTDFIFESATALQSNTSGLGSAISPLDINLGDTGGHPGIIALVAGTAATGRAALTPGVAGTNTLQLGFGEIVFETDILLEDLSDVTDTYSARAGFNNAIIGDGNDSVMFRYTDTVNGGRWQAVTRNAGVENAIDTTIPVAADTWYKLRIVINTVADEVYFYINGTLVATELGPTIPANRTTSAYIGIIKSAGAVVRRLLIDYIFFQTSLAVAR